MIDFDAEPNWRHYAIFGLAVLGIWYLISKMSHGSVSRGPVADTAVDLSAMVVFGGGA